jgi:hypothetical protein
VVVNRGGVGLLQAVLPLIGDVLCGCGFHQKESLQNPRMPLTNAEKHQFMP